jgi:hypothetical protein
MISNSRIRITLHSCLLKYYLYNKKPRQVINTDTLKLYAVYFRLKYTQRSAFKAII